MNGEEWTAARHRRDHQPVSIAQWQAARRRRRVIALIAGFFAALGVVLYVGFTHFVGT